MESRIVIVANGFSRQNVRLQPWRYLYEIARRLATRATLTVLTEGPAEAEEKRWPEGFTVVSTNCLSVRRQELLGRLISGYEATQIWWSVTPRSIAYRGLLRSLAGDKYALITCPLYSYRQLFRASRAGVPFDELRALWQQRLIPRRAFSRFLGSGIFRKVFVQSEANREVLLNAAVPESRLALLRVGIDAEDRGRSVPVNDESERVEGASGSDGKLTVLYFGAVRRIRGYHALVNAFGIVAGATDNARLRILARGATNDELTRLRAGIESRGLAGKVDLVGGWLTREQVWDEIERSDIVALPFVIVPSDIPIAILEAMARGKPVVGSPVDGIPELIEGRGVVADPLDEKALAGAILSLLRDRKRRVRLGNNARAFMEAYPDWDAVGRHALAEAGLA